MGRLYGIKFELKHVIVQSVSKRRNVIWSTFKRYGLYRMKLEIPCTVDCSYKLLSRIQ